MCGNLMSLILTLSGERQMPVLVFHFAKRGCETLCLVRDKSCSISCPVLYEAFLSYTKRS